MLDGKIAEIGTYSELMAADGALSKLVAEHGSFHPFSFDASPFLSH